MALPLTIEAASDTYGRKDAVVIRLSYTNRSISITVKTGTPAASPVAPSMTRNATTYEMALAYVNVAAGASSVTVTDKRSDSSVCGWAAVAQATSGEVDQMLNDMKTGFDGLEYPSPAAMVQGCDQILQDEMTNATYYDATGEYTKTVTLASAAAVRVDAENIFFHKGDIVEIYIENVTEGMITNTVVCPVYINNVRVGNIFILTRGQFFTVGSDTKDIGVYVPSSNVSSAGTFKLHINCLNRRPSDHYLDLIGQNPDKIVSIPEATYHAESTGNSLTASFNGSFTHCEVSTMAADVYAIAFPIRNGSAVRFVLRVNGNNPLNNIVIYTVYSKTSWASNATIIYDGGLSKGIHYFDISAEQATSRRFIMIRFNDASTYDFDYYCSYQADKSFDTPVEIFAYHAVKADSAEEADHLKDKSYNDIVFWGDSITAGAGTGTGEMNFVEKCCSLLGTTRYSNAGVGGETSWTISARQGGNVVYIPKGAVSGSHYTLTDRNGNPIRPFEQGYLMGGGPPKYAKMVTVNGFTGELKRNGTDDYSILDVNTTLLCDTPLIFPGANLSFKIAVIFVGTNDWDDNDPTESIPYVKAMVAKQANKNYIVMSSYRANSPVYEQAMLDEFGSHYFNTRKMLVDNGLNINGLTPTSADETAISAGLVPPSLLADAIHPNGYGHNAIGIMLYNHFVFLGYDTLL
jgi:lysophospholipase L1-like esterase